MFRDPSIDTCIDVLRDNNYIVLEEEDAKKNLNELEEIYGDELIRAVESWLREKGKVVVDMKPSHTSPTHHPSEPITRNELPCRDCGNEDYCNGNIDEYLKLCNLYGYILPCSGFTRK